jgi:hypothetical protein
VFISEDATEYTWPRWSPDGRSIAAGRRRLGGPSELVVIDVATRDVRPLVSLDRGRAISPMWLPDGGTVLFSSDHEGGPVTLYRVDVQSGVVARVEGAGAGAQSPALSPDGSRLVFVGYSADGYDLYALPWSGPTRVDVPGPSRITPDLKVGPTSPASTRRPDIGASRPYTPWSTLAPRFWVPYVEADGDNTTIGAATGGFDALGRHTYALSGGWTIPRNRPDLYVDYAYTRWWPALFAGASDDTDSWRQGTVRSRDTTAGVLLPWRQVRWSSSVLAAVSASDDAFDCAACEEPIATIRRRRAGRLGAAVSNAKRFGYSISAEQGGAANVMAEFARGSGGGTATSLVAELRGYRRAVPRHAVLAVRAAAATSRGDEGVRRVFSGAGSAAQPGGFDISIDAIGLLRGFDTDDVSGRSAAALNLDYRFPLAWPQRGLGTWPVFLRAIHGAVFADAGHAWDGGFRRADLRRALGGELSFDVVLGGTFPVTLATGAAWRHDPSGARDGAAVFARIGRAF